MKAWRFFTFFTLFSSALNAADMGYPFQLDASAVWMKRVRTLDIDLIDYNRSFCSCTCGGTSFNSADLLHDLDRRLGAEITLLIRDKNKHTVEFIGTTPFDFQITKNFNATDSVNLACGIVFGHQFSSTGGTQLTPLIDIDNTDYIGADKGNTIQ